MKIDFVPMEESEEMSVKEIDRLIDWLLANGHTEAEAIASIKHIANAENKKAAK